MKIDNAAKDARDAIKEKYSSIFARNFEIAMREYKKQGTIKSLAEEFCVTPNTLGLYLKGEILPTVANALAIADKFNVSLDDLFGRNEAFAPIPKEAKKSDYVKALLALEDADIVDIKMNDEELQLKLVCKGNEDIIEFFKNYKAFSEMSAGQGDRAKSLYRNWLNSQLEQLDNPGVGADKTE